MLASVGADPLVWRVALHPQIPTTYMEAQRMTVGELAEHLAWADALDHAAHDARLEAELDAAARRAGGRHG